ncbi:MAG: glycerophosphodiester phosphodiesterase family protein [Microbacterium sp.]
MPHPAVPDRAREQLQPLFVVGVLAVASLIIAFLGATPARVSAVEMLGDPRMPGDAAFIASHRGGSATAPENTLPAITAALEDGVGYVEVDVALTADSQPVLMHDARVDRTTDGTGRLAELTLADVRALDAGSWFDPAFAGTAVPTFVEFLDELDATGGRAIIELKGVWDAVAIDAAHAEVLARGLERDVAVASFDARTLALWEAETEVVSRLLNLKHVPDDVVAAAEQAGVQGVIVDRDEVLERPTIVDELHAAGVRIVVYTLNHDTQWHAVTALGVDGIVTDDPHMLLRWQSSSAGE